MGNGLLRWSDLLVLGLGFSALLTIGCLCARRGKSAEGYFLAGRSMPGWALGFSLMATIVSSMTFLALPAFAFEHNWRHFPGCFSYLAAMPVALLLFIPMYRSTRVNSAYEYLERRFAPWARLYAAACFVLFQIFRMGIVLYMVCLCLQTFIGGDLALIMIIFGILVAAYTIVGGLQAVIWTDVLQGVALIGGGFFCLPFLVSKLPGGFGQLFSVATADDKFSWGSMDLDLTQITIWAIVLSKLVIYLQILGTDQTSVQRYCAAKSDRDARKAVVLGCCLTVPVWTYFLFVGTALHVFYQVLPEEAVAGLKPDQVFPYFIVTHVPAGVAGFVIFGLLAAAMSTLDSSINAAAATVTTDFYGRLWVKGRSPVHYAVVGRLLSLVFSVVMIATALVIHCMRSAAAVEDLQTMMLSILGGGLLSLFLLGFLTRRVDSRAACIATVLTVLSVATWLLMDTSIMRAALPGVSSLLPDKFWVGVFANLLLFAVGYGVSLFLGNRKEKNLLGLTVWTVAEPKISPEDRE